ncbi:M42 family metallopeptidase [Neobacillus sp. PS3-34]|uniref:M42 family metallopeptidase n=1 Tax=Neobacillus sp. PS3-34 TaxID=3070678 RepID=UPI0027DFD50B|nr:M42 family metallopeptidase [Neobacillus sp. PS3-34]WML48019.1 M42 family metallopeptidase [Neobacillus sp. PS3-34]
MESNVIKMFKELTETNGIVGHEKPVREVMKKYLEPLADEITYDHLGSIIAVKKSAEDAPRVMLTSHLDEIGFMVTNITDEGFLKFTGLGGWWEHVMLAQRVNVITRSCDMVEGVIGSKPPHILKAEERKKVVSMNDMFIDIGAESKEEAFSFGVRPGDVIAVICPFTIMKNPKLMMAKAWDNRIGCAIVIEVMKRLKDEQLNCTLFGVGAVQEEVGLRGAKTAANKIQPDISFAIDVGIAGDTPGISKTESNAKIGKGPQIVLYDSSLVSHPGLRNFVTDLADELSIPFQFEALPFGGTDAGATHTAGSGAPSLAITIATRYIHSHAAVLHYDDFENTVNLFVNIFKRLNKETVQNIIF